MWGHESWKSLFSEETAKLLTPDGLETFWEAHQIGVKQATWTLFRPIHSGSEAGVGGFSAGWLGDGISSSRATALACNVSDQGPYLKGNG